MIKLAHCTFGWSFWYLTASLDLQAHLTNSVSVVTVGLLICVVSTLNFVYRFKLLNIMDISAYILALRLHCVNQEYL